MRHHHVMHEQSDQMVLEYLGRVGDVAHRKLRSDERLDFMTRLRRRIDETRTSTGAVEPEQVRKVISRFGDPARLVERELRRLERERASELAELADGRVASDGPEPEGDGTTEPIPVVPASVQPAGPARIPQQAPKPAPATQTSRRPVNSSAPWARTRREPKPPRPAHPRTAARGGPARPTYEGPPTYEDTAHAFPGMRGLSETLSHIDLRILVREHRLETAAIVLVGLGGLLIPFPYAFVPLLAGVACIAVSRTWIARDKLIGLLAPVAGLILGVFVVGAVTRSERVAVDVSAYAAALTGHGMTFVRIGALIGACYLALRLLKIAAGSASPSSAD